MTKQGAFRVQAVHCDHRAGDEEVYLALRRATLGLDRAWARLRSARRIGIKFNQAWPPERLAYYEGQLRELVSERVARATLRLLRENTDAEIICTEIPAGSERPRAEVEANITLMSVLREFGVAFIDGDAPPHRVYQVPGGGSIFSQYLLPESVGEMDAFVSVQKLKNHKFMGVTLCLKNLFGLAPQPPHGRARQYFHHLVRMPYVLADLGAIIQPTLNIVDALVGQAGAEWGGEGRVCDALIAGDQVTATDACAAYVMGHDPAGDWPDLPYGRDRNALVAAAEAGLGTVDLNAIDFGSEVERPLAAFYSEQTDPLETLVSWRRSTCEQALFYRDHQKEFVDRYAGQYILLQEGEVRWHDTASELHRSRRELAGASKDQAMWLKLVDPEEAEGEHYEVYERTLEHLAKVHPGARG
ncbi:MAG: DUF362 domain-containing protein [Anaerolineae bacterium]